MRWLEVDAKKVLASHGVKIPRGVEVTDGHAAAQAIKQLGAPALIKAQVPVAERAKMGGIAWASSPQHAASLTEAILATTFDGVSAHSVLVEQSITSVSECYVAWFLETRLGNFVALFSNEGGSGLESRFNSGEVLRWSPLKPLRRYHLLQALEGRVAPENILSVANLMFQLYQAFCAQDATMLEINPVLVTSDGDLVAVDCHLVTDDNAAYRHPEIPYEIRSNNLEQRFAEAGFNYVDLDGDVGIIANGAGFTMATVDLTASQGARPANFLEVGGAAYTRAEEATTLLLQKHGLRVIFLNLFGAFARVDVISSGVLRALERASNPPPVVAHIRGTGEDIAWKLLSNRDGIYLYTELTDALQAVVRLEKSTMEAEQNQGRRF